MNKEKLLVEETMSLQELLTQLGVFEHVEKGEYKVFVDGVNIALEELPTKKIKPSTKVLVLPLLHGG